MISMNKIFYYFCKGTNNKNKNLYETLKVSRKASPQEIKTNYYKLAKQYHPDSNPKETETFKQINQAYSILKDPTKKSIYDAQNFTEKGSPKTTTYYNTQHDYGYVNRKRQNHRPYNPYGYGQNPFQSSTNPYGMEINEYLKQQYQKNIRQAQRQARKQHQKVNNVMLTLFGVVSVMLVAQIILKVYQFNAIKKKYSYPERLSPKDFR